MEWLHLKAQRVLNNLNSGHGRRIREGIGKHWFLEGLLGSHTSQANRLFRWGCASDQSPPPKGRGGANKSGQVRGGSGAPKPSLFAVPASCGRSQVIRGKDFAEQFKILFRRCLNVSSASPSPGKAYSAQLTVSESLPGPEGHQSLGVSKSTSAIGVSLRCPGQGSELQDRTVATQSPACDLKSGGRTGKS